MRYDNWKIVFMEQRCRAPCRSGREPFTRLRLPKLFNLRTDPYEFADITSNTYYDWFLHHAYFIYAAQAVAAKFVETFKDFPPVQKPEQLHHRRRDGEDERGFGWRRLSEHEDGRRASAARCARVAPCQQPCLLHERRRGVSAILDFVARVTKEGGPDFVPPTRRSATSTSTAPCRRAAVRLEHSIRPQRLRGRA